MKGLFPAAGLSLLCATVAFPQEPKPSPSPAPPPEEDQVVKREEVVVVTASKTETTLVNAPATLSVVSSAEILTSPAQNYGDLLRSVPGLNVIQLSARDVQMTSRQSTNTLVNSQLALLDGRSIYLDFFGLVLWDFVPTNSSDIKQIEVVRGPASAVWGANALTGVINIITKSPREAAAGHGTNLTLSGGLLDRNASPVGQDLDTGSSYGASFSTNQAPNDTWSYRIAGGFYHSDAFPRPVGRVPPATHPLDPNEAVGARQPPATGQFPPFSNTPTNQPKLDLRVDQEVGGGGRMTYNAGIAGTKGIIHTGIGPFDLRFDSDKKSYMGYGKVGYGKGALKINAFANLVDAEAPNLLSTDLQNVPILLSFKTKTFDLEAGHLTVVGGKHILSYGGNVRRNTFDISIARNAKDRTELGAYVQDEIFFERFRFTIGGRVDKFGNLDDPVFSPRITAMFKPLVSHSIRLSFNRAFRAPSVINNFLDVGIKAPGADFPLGAVCQLAPPLCAANPGLARQVLPLGPRAIGSEVARGISPSLPELKQESLNAYEVAYTGTFGGRTTVGLAFYINDSNDNINFVTTPAVVASVGLPAFYTSRNPPPGWPFPVSLLDLPPLRAAAFDRVPATYVYLNLGPLRQKGLEVSLDQNITDHVSGFANYSWQDDPKPLDPDAGQLRYAIAELSVPPHHRFNAGLNLSTKRFLGSASVNYVSRAFWQDVLASLGFDGFTNSFTMVNASFGVRWADGKVTTMVKGTNLLNEDIRQHIFGDVIKRTLVGEVRFQF
jgi:outer membrane receptor protein involved in Fe transport